MAIEIQTETWYILWTVIIVVIVGLSIAIIKFQRLYQESQNQLKGQLKERGKQSRQMGINEIKGGYNQILGTFSLLNEYDDVILLSTTKGGAPLDLIGINQDSLDFIEIKTKGADLEKSESKVKRLVQAKKVNYRIVDVDLPVDFKIEDRKMQDS